MEKYVYDGDLSDKNSYATHKFLTVISCGIHINANHITERKKGRNDYHLLYVESGEMICEIDGKEEKILPGGYVLYLPHKRQKYEQNGGICYWVHFNFGALREALAMSCFLLGLYAYFKNEKFTKNVEPINKSK